MKNIKLLGLFMLVSIMAFAQRPSKEDIASMKIAYITEKLSLKPAEAEKFWPVYNEMNEQMDIIRKEQRELHHKLKSEELTDKDAKSLMGQSFELKERELQLKKTYHDKFMNILSPVRVAQLHHAEQEFKRHLIKEIRDKARSEKGMEREKLQHERAKKMK